MASDIVTSEVGWLRAAGRRRLARLGLALMSCFAVAVLTAGERYRLPTVGRLAELVSCVFAWEAAVPLCGRLLAMWRGSPATASPLRLAVTILVASVPATLGIAAVFRLAGETPALPLATYGQSLLLGLLLAFARRGLTRGGATPATAGPGPHAEAVAPPSVAVQVLLRRHAPKLAGQGLLALEAEDHYVRFHTESGSSLALMRLCDAVAALGPEAGWQPHRSFWLSADAAARAERSGQGWTLTLQNGLVVPVSRANVARLRAADYRADRVTSLPAAPTRATAPA